MGLIMSAKVIVFAGSIRDGSLNIKLADVLTNALTELGADATHICAKDYQLPLFNEDLEVPEKAIALAKLFEQSDGFVFVSPEYNASVTPLMKNTLDWVSVSGINSSHSFGPYKDKMCFIASCSPGKTGGLRGLYHLRAILMNVGAEIITPQLSVGEGATAFDENGTLKDPHLVSLMGKGLDELLFTIQRIKAVPRS